MKLVLHSETKKSTLPFFTHILFGFFILQSIWSVQMLAGMYLLKVNIRNSRTRYEICSKLTIKTPGTIHWAYFTHCHGVSIVNFEHVIAGWDAYQEAAYNKQVAEFQLLFHDVTIHEMHFGVPQFWKRESWLEILNPLFDWMSLIIKPTFLLLQHSHLPLFFLSFFSTVL